MAMGSERTRRRLGARGGWIRSWRARVSRGVVGFVGARLEDGRHGPVVSKQRPATALSKVGARQGRLPLNTTPVSAPARFTSLSATSRRAGRPPGLPIARLLRRQIFSAARTAATARRAGGTLCVLLFFVAGDWKAWDLAFSQVQYHGRSRSPPITVQ